jgi:hypothetical protein
MRYLKYFENQYYFKSSPMYIAGVNVFSYSKEEFDAIKSQFKSSKQPLQISLNQYVIKVEYKSQSKGWFTWMLIYKLSDEWYYVSNYLSNSENSSDGYRCDQLDGLLYYINDQIIMN